MARASSGTAAAADLPLGTVTFLFTDIEGSTRLLQELGARYPEVLDRHRAVLRSEFERTGGTEVGTYGDSFFVAFPDAPDAVEAAAAGQRRLLAEDIPAGVPVRVRMGIHTGLGAVSDGTYVGLDVHRASRIMSAAHGGQVLLSEATAVLAAPELPDGLSLRDLGEHRLKDLSRPEHLHQLVVDDLPADFPPPKTLQPTLDNLPLQLTSFVGREREVDEASDLLRTARLLTLVGPGGAGKTRLALEIAGRVGRDFADGVRFVPLAAIRDAELVPSAVGQALQVLEAGRGNRTITDRLVEYLRDRELLLVLDNFEQVLASAPVVAELLAGAPRLRVLVTTRAALRVGGEQQFQVPPMELPDPRRLPPLDELAANEAIALFVQRASGVRPGFALTEENAAAVAEICVRVDGLPLAIELAASRAAILSPAAILSRLEQRLALLAGGGRDLPPRQQALRTAIDWSHDLLSPSGRRLFRRLGVFAGGGTLEEIERVCAGAAEPLGVELLDGLTSLSQESLLTASEDDRGEPRFGMLQTIREYAVERLTESGEEPEIRDLHADTFLALAEQTAPLLVRAARGRWLDRLERELDNFRAAIDWSVDRGDVERALRLGGAVWRLWQMRGYIGEGRDRLLRILAMPGADQHPEALMRGLEAAGGIAHWEGAALDERSYYGRWLALARERGDTSEIASALFNLSYAYLPFAGAPESDAAATVALLDEAEALFREVGDEVGLARLHEARAVQALFHEDYATAERESAEGARALRPLEEGHFLAWCLSVEGLSMINRGDWAGALPALRESLVLFAAGRDISAIALSLNNFSAVALLQGDAEQASRLAGAAAEMTAASGTTLADFMKRTPAALGFGPQAPGEGRLAAAWAEGQSLSVEEAVACALGEA